MKPKTIISEFLFFAALATIGIGLGAILFSSKHKPPALPEGYDKNEWKYSHSQLEEIWTNSEGGKLNFYGTTSLTIRK